MQHTELEGLLTRIERTAPLLAARSVDEMYRNPFWSARFGDRGRRFADEDGRHHVRYLIDALRWSSPAVMLNYATWLRGVLVARGMCSLHLAENFQRLRSALVAGIGMEAEPALDLLDAATAALARRESSAAEVERVAPAVAGVARARLASEGVLPAARSASGEPTDPEYLLSYVADALGEARPAVATDYVQWLASYLGTQPGGKGAAAASAIAAAVSEALAEAGAADGAALLAQVGA